MSRASKSWAAALLLVAAAGSLTAGAVPSQAASDKHAPAPVPAPVVVATGLDNPRGVELLPDGTILIGEAGDGPVAPCVASSPGAITRCLGFSGSVYRIKGSTQGRVATGLPSEAIVRTDGTTVIAGATQAVPGPHGTYIVIYGLSGGPAERASLGAGSGPLGTLSLTNGKVVGDLAAYDAQLDPTGPFVDPWNFVRDGNDFLATDAGANDLFLVHHGVVTTAFAFPDNVLASGQQVQAVPTGIVRGRNGVFYISDMSGEQPGYSRIWRYVPGHQPTVLTTGLTDVLSLALTPDGNLIAMSYGSTEPVGTAVPGPGALTRIDVHTGTKTTINTGDLLHAPTGVAVSHVGDIYVVNNAITTDGELLKFPGAAR